MNTPTSHSPKSPKPKSVDEALHTAALNNEIEGYAGAAPAANSPEVSQAMARAEALIAKKRKPKT